MAFEAGDAVDPQGTGLWRTATRSAKLVESAGGNASRCLNMGNAASSPEIVGNTTSGNGMERMLEEGGLKTERTLPLVLKIEESRMVNLLRSL